MCSFAECKNPIFLCRMCVVEALIKYILRWELRVVMAISLSPGFPGGDFLPKSSFYESDTFCVVFAC